LRTDHRTVENCRVQSTGFLEKNPVFLEKIRYEIQFGEKSGTFGEKSGEKGEKFGIDTKSLPAVVYHNKHCQSVDFGCCMTGQHPGLTRLRKYWLSSHDAGKDDLLYS
jgi:hypothetical protein